MNRELTINNQIDLLTLPTSASHQSISRARALLHNSDTVIDEIRHCLDDQFSCLREACTAAGKFDNDLFDQHQHSSYSLALCVAELKACEVITGYAMHLPEEGISDGLALCFIAESLAGIIQRLEQSGGSLPWAQPLTRSLESIRTGPAYRDIVSTGLDAEFMAALGGDIAEQSLFSLPSGLAEDKAMMRSTFRRFAEEVVVPVAESIHREDRDIPESLIEQAAALGCFGSCIPERFGGTQPDDQADSLGMIVVTEELSRASLGAAGSLVTRPEIAARALLKGGSEAQQCNWLPRLASGETLCAIAITEPDAGSDVAVVKLKARPTEGGWLLNGSKTWSSFAGRSELLLVLARTDPDPAGGFKGLSLFLVEKPRYPGHTFTHQQEPGGSITGKAIPTLGYRGMHSFDLFFEDYFVPAGNLLGEETGIGQGFYYTMAGFAGGRLQTAARAVGVMQAAFEKAVQYARNRKVFGNPVADYQLTRIKLARMLATLTASRQFSYDVARKLDSGGGQMEASLVKLFTCRAAEWVTREAMQIHGGMGYAEESAVSRYFVDARVLSIFEGTEEVLAIKVIARDLIANVQ